MRSLTRPRGKLPARVYWFRRGLVLVTVFAVVFGIGRLLGGDGDESAAQEAAPAAARPSASPTTPETRPIGPVQVQAKPRKAGKKGAQQKKQENRKPSEQAKATKTPLAQPSGPCAADEVTIQADVGTAAAGGKITIPLQLTGTQAACRFAFGPDTVVVKITSGKDRIWSSQDCRRAIKKRNVVVRSAQPTRVDVTWSGRRSDEGCPVQTGWALPGYYHAVTAAIGSEPSDTQFRLTAPPRAVVTKTAEPKPKS